MFSFLKLGIICFYLAKFTFGYDEKSKGRFNLYISNTTNESEGHMCYNETKTPAPVKKIDCNIYGRYVIFYIEIKNGVYSSYVFNGLYIEVIVKGCGYYGSECIAPCPQNCKDQKCDVKNGSCDSCIDGYQRQFCESECDINFYGAGCGMQCSNCINADYCNHIDGTCPNGCAPGWRENTCKTKCGHGTYGLGCNNSCSVNCLENYTSVCDHVTGSCTSGCADGWKGTHCNTECEETYYGENCELNCSSDCVNKTCDAITGDCILLSTQGKEVNHDSSNAVVAGGVVGGVIAFCALLAVVVVSFIRCKRRTENQYEDTLHANVLDNDNPYTTITASATMTATSSLLNIYKNIAYSSSVDEEDQKAIKKTTEPLYVNIV